ncbi:MAG: hypothetical protein JWN86_1197 [Planctomycetota bacterium]|nr:hypothetical protein [Planctomycetota bacterium]
MGEMPRRPGVPHPDPIAQLLGRIAWLMDRAFRVPGTRVQVGLDALLGLLPLGGDVLTGLIQAGLVLVALGRYRVPPAVAVRMMANVLLDVGVGSIPLLGDLFDVAFKANTRNMALLEPYLHPAQDGISQGKSPYARVIDVTPVGISWGCLLAVAVILLAALVLVLIGFITVVRWLLRP